ncbi:Uncharacterised protein [Vibrio cholerae]|nr:Uncharacterised protein [Vibrio cholerae]CSB90016.1 Uncharacterised protein [Vibrio cholerae]
MDTAIKVAVARQYRCSVEIAFNNFLLNSGIERATHAVTGGTGIRHNPKTKLFEFREQPSFLQIQFGDFRAGRERGFHPRLTFKAELISFFGE